MSKKSENEDGVGYGRPPKGSQFPKGQSGNPAGRPKGARNLRPRNWEERLTDLIQAETEREVTIRENGTLVTLTVIQAIIKSLSVAAIKGSVKAQALVIDMTRTAAGARAQKEAALNEALMHYKDGWEKVFAECDANGEPRPDLPMDPEDIVVDPATGNLTYIGAIVGWCNADDRQNIRLHENEIRNLKRELEAETEPEIRKLIEKDIEVAEKILGMLREIAGKAPPTKTPGKNPEN